MFNTIINHLPIIFAIIAGVVFMCREFPVFKFGLGRKAGIKNTNSMESDVFEEDEEDEVTKVFPSVGYIGPNLWRD